MSNHSEAAVEVDVLVIGAGFGGVGMAIRLAQAGRNDYVVIERGADVGGAWRDNTYPGAACDVPSNLYSYSFAPNPNWSRSFSPQAEIQQYIHRTAEQFGVLDHIRFGTEVELAQWDPTTSRWQVRTSNGTYSARILIPAVGALCEPNLPAIDGIETFAGELFHSARWNHEADLAGKRVAVIGTGASAIQIVPELAKTATRLDVYQRTAPWVLPRTDRAYRGIERMALKYVPGMQLAARAGVYWSREAVGMAMSYEPRLVGVLERLGRLNIARGIKDPALRKAVTPTYEVGCKRMLLSNEWYPTLARENVSLITEPIEKITANSVVTGDGVSHEVDALVVCTGFHVTDSPAFARIVNADGVSLGQLWQDKGQSAYKGTTVAGFPNMMLLIGPNTGQGHTSMVFIIESQLNYMMDALAQLQAEGATTFEVRERAQEDFNAGLQKRMQRSVWTNGGCSSWYLDANGNNTTLWPGSTWSFHNATKKFDLGAYRTTRAGSAEADVTSKENAV